MTTGRGRRHKVTRKASIIDVVLIEGSPAPDGIGYRGKTIRSKLIADTRFSTKPREEDERGYTDEL